MEDEWDYRKRRRPFWWDIERDIERMFEDIMREFEEMFHPMRLRDLEKELEKQGIKPYVYGFRITIGPDGKPVVEEFGNVRRVKGRPIITEEREPLVDVFESGDEITVIAEMPGVEKEKIETKISEDGKTLVISASDTNRKYYKEVELPSEVDPSSAKAVYRNGVLEVKMKKARKEKKGFKISVE
ncbi:MAG: archaeal heat shock protein Hsp20 [Thermosphaera sp.]